MTFLANMQSDSDHHLALSARFGLIVFFFARTGNAIFMEVTRNDYLIRIYANIVVCGVGRNKNRTQISCSISVSVSP